MAFVAIKNGPPARREEGAYLHRYVTDEQRSRRPIFIATLRAVASWLFFRVARSTRMNQIWALRSRLEKQPTGRRRKPCYLWDRTLGTCEKKASSAESARERGWPIQPTNQATILPRFQRWPAVATIPGPRRLSPG